MKVNNTQVSFKVNGDWQVNDNIWQNMKQSLYHPQDKLFDISKRNVPDGIKVDLKLNTKRLGEVSHGLKIVEMWKRLNPGQKKFVAGAGAATAIFATPLFIASSVVYGAYELFLRRR